MRDEGRGEGKKNWAEKAEDWQRGRLSAECNVACCLNLDH